MSKFEQHLSDSALSLRLHELPYKVRYCSNRAYVVFYVDDEPHSYFLTIEQARILLLDLITELNHIIHEYYPEQRPCRSSTYVLGKDWRSLQATVSAVKSRLREFFHTSNITDRYLNY